MFDLEETVMGIIVNAGQSRSLCFEALRHAKQGQFVEADSLLKEANHYARDAHAVQTQLIEADEGLGENPNDISHGPCARSFDDIHFSERTHH